MGGIDSACSSLRIACGLSGGVSSVAGGVGSGGHGIGTATGLVAAQPVSQIASTAVSSGHLST